MDEDDDVPLNDVSSVKPKAPDGVSAFQLASSGRSGAEMFEEENAAIAGEDLTVVLQFPDKEISVQVRPAPPRGVPTSHVIDICSSLSRRFALCADEDGSHGRAAQAQSSRVT